MSILGIDEITFGAHDIARCRQFFLDWGLTLVEETPLRLVYESLNGCRVIVAHSDTPGLPAGIEADPTLREVVWGVANAADMAHYGAAMQQWPGFVQSDARVGCTDPSGLTIRVQISRKKDIDLDCAQVNTWNERSRVDQASPAYERACPIEVGHVVLFVKSLEAVTQFYQEVLGFVISDRYPGRGHFLRCAPRGGHHDLFLLQLPEARNGLNHVAFTVRDHHEVFGGGLHMSRCGWDTELGPGRHPISSAIFWYFNSPAGALVEYYADEDELTENWQAREFTPGPTMFAEWAIKGGIDGETRRQKNAEAPSGRFMTDKPKA
ncbi:VOC family protein [Limnohabitans sp. G3-2]|uniref:VOC family protein n=1 Tax=Limnohabitans sp. G3-2 TaxID=1100711 RepID=UPI000C1EE194|nr:VOC family protein [Limnohabitans sp. G3-2]PIT74915.1 glyoxalase [Limnohabitans sp. G3-2]